MADHGETEGSPPGVGGDVGEQLLEAVLTIAGDLALETILERIVEAACRLVAAEYGALGVVSEEGERLSAFVHRGLDDDTARAIGELPHGRGILGTLIEHPTPLRLDDLRHHPDSYGFPANHPPMHSFLGVPIRVRGEVFGNLYLTEKAGGVPFTADDERLVVGLAAVAGAAVQQARRLDEAQRRDAWRDAVLEVSAAVVGQEPANLVRRRIAELACSLVDADGAVVVEAHQDGVWVLATVGDAPSEGFLAAGTSAATDTLEDGASQRTLDGPVFGRPSMWTPIRASDGVIAAVGVARAAPFGAVEERLLEAFGAQASVAWTYERAQTELRRLSVLADRERIGRDLHDTVIQRLFATGLSLQATARRVEGDPDLAPRLDRAVDDIDATVREIRSTIFALQAPGEAVAGIRSRVLDVIEEVTPSLPRTPRVRFDGPIDSVVGEDVATHLLPALREGLTNVAKHAEASDVEVELQVDAEGLRLRIADDGRGVPEHASGGFGLRNLAERARALGGTFEVRPGAEGRGTVLVWTLPAE